MNHATATRLWSLEAPTITVDWSQMVIGGSGPVTIPVPSFLIEHPKGLVLFDTGFNPDAAGAPEEIYGGLATAFDMQFARDVSIEETLKKRGFSRADIKWVVVSHLHFDHAGGALQFPNATLVLGPGEFANAHDPQPSGAAFYTGVDLGLAKQQKWLHIPYGTFDMFGDGSLVVHHTPGHTPGQLSLVVKLPHRNFILTGDTAHGRRGLLEDIPNQYDYNTAEAIQSLQRLKVLAAELEASVWVSHDPEDWADFHNGGNAHE